MVKLVASAQFGDIFSFLVSSNRINRYANLNQTEMKTLVVVLLSLIVVSCSTDSKKNELLTSLHWKESKPSEDASKPAETLSFLEDGTFVSDAGVFKINGKWSWKNENEISVEITGMTTGGQSNAFDKSSKYKVRILEISDKGLKTLEVAEGDGWDSGFAVERNFTSQNL